MKTYKRYKFIRTGFKSEFGSHKWKKGEWCAASGDPKLCSNGFHCSKRVYQAFSYVQGEILCQVEVSGKSDVEDTKEAWEKMRVIKMYKWTKIDSVLFAIYAARLVLHIFEKEYPNDDRPRKAIEAAEKYAKHPTKKNADAAWAAARAAGAAGAAGAAWAAGDAGDAAWAARAAGDAFYKELDIWMKKHIKNLKEI